MRTAIWLKCVLAMFAVPAFGAAEPAFAQDACVTRSVAKASIPSATLDLYSLQGNKVVLKTTLNLGNKVGAIEVKDCPNIGYFAYEYKGETYLIKRAALQGYCTCAAPALRDGGRAGAGEPAQCQKSACR